MTSEVFNPNPTIIATAAPRARRRAVQARHSLWLSDADDDEDSDIYDYSADDEPEPIDADEIFGLFLLSLFFCPALRQKKKKKLSELVFSSLKTLFVPSATRSIAR
jgi:hypothetical protein